MDIEFHYHVILFLCLQAGLKREDARTVAYSSQYTDDNSLIYMVRLKDGVYRNFVSQTLNIRKPQKKLLRIYPVFHFMPGKMDEVLKAEPVRKDAKIHLLMTLPGNENAELLLEDAIKSRNLYRIGISLHTYADTFSHQNFVGLPDEYNSKNGLLERVIPNIGHADFGSDPDRIGGVWEDVRLRSNLKRVENNLRFLEAGLRIYDHLCKISENQPKEESYVKKILEEMLYSNTESRPIIMRRHIPEDLISYRNDLYLRDAIEIPYSSKIFRFIVRIMYRWKFLSFSIPVLGRADFKSSSWFKFQEAVKEHQKRALEILRPVLSVLEVENL